MGLTFFLCSQAWGLEAESYFQEGLKLEKAKKYDQAISRFMAAYQLDHGMAKAFKHAGNCMYLNRNQTKDLEYAYGAALAYYDRYLDLSPTDKAVFDFLPGLRNKVEKHVTYVPAEIWGKLDASAVVSHASEKRGWLDVRGFPFPFRKSKGYVFYVTDGPWSEPKPINSKLNPLYATSLRVTGLEPGKTYSFQISIVWDSGVESPVSETRLKAVAK